MIDTAIKRSSLEVRPFEPRFYVTGGTLPIDAECYVPRRADGELLESLLAGEFCYVLDTRQMGKSSLMVQTAARLKERGVTVAVVDLTAIGQNLTAEQWYDGLLNLIGRKLDLEDQFDDFWARNKHLGPLQRWMTAIQNVLLRAFDGPIVIFVDEIDVVRSLPFSTDEFFAGIRESYNLRADDPDMRRLTFCLLGVATPSSLIRETNVTPFNIGRRIDLSDFSPTEAAPLAQGLRVKHQASSVKNGAGRSALNAQRFLDRVLYWTGGHPYLTQRLCQAVVAASSDPLAQQPYDPAMVDRLCDDLFLSRKARERDDNLLFVRDRMLQGEADVEAVLDLYSQLLAGKRISNNDADFRISALRLAGIARPDGDRLALRNEIYRRVFDRAWIQSNMPHAELLRQRAAFRRGVLRTASATLSIVVVMAALAITAVGYARRADKNRREADLRAKQARELAHNLQLTVADRDFALKRLGGALNSEAKERRRADKKSTEARANERQANSDRAEAVRQKRIAQEKTKESRYRLARYYVSNGMRLVNQGSPVEALLWLAEALRLEADDTKQGPIQRLRVASVLDRCPRLLQVFPGHGVLSPDGQKVLTYSDDGTARIWRAATGAPITPLFRHPTRVTIARFSQDGNYVLTAANQPGPGGIGYARFWDAQTGRPIGPSIPIPGGISEMSLNPDCRLIAVCSLWGRSSGVLDARTGKPLYALRRYKSGVTCVRFSPDGRRLAIACSQWEDESTKSGIQILDSATGALVQTLPGRQFAEFSPDGRRLAAMDLADGTTAVFDLITSRLTCTAPAGGGPGCWSPDSKRLALAAWTSWSQVWDVDANREVTPRLEVGPSAGRCVFSPDGQRFAAGCETGIFRVFDSASGDPITPPLPNPNSGEFDYPSFSPDGYMLLTGKGGVCRLWSLTPAGDSSTVLKMSAGPYNDWGNERYAWHPSFSGDGRLMITKSRDGKAWIWYLDTARSAPPLTHSGPVTSTFLSQDGRFAATGSEDRTARVWNAAGRPLCKPLRHPAAVRCVSLSADGQTLATGCDDGYARLWNVRTGSVEAEMSRRAPVRQIHFSPDDSRILVFAGTPYARDASVGVLARQRDGNFRLAHSWKHPAWMMLRMDRWDGRTVALGEFEETIGIYDANTGNRLASTNGPNRFMGFASMSPSRRRIATGGIDWAFGIWDINTGRLTVSPVRQANAAAADIEFSPDGSLLVTAGEDMRIYETATGEMVTPPVPGMCAQVGFSPDGRRILALSWGRTIRLYSLWRADRPVQDLLLEARLRSGQAVDRNGVVAGLTAESLRHNLDALRRRSRSITP